MNKFNVIGTLAGEPYKLYVRDKRQVYGFTLHTESRGHTECITVVADENSIVGLRIGHKYMCRGQVVSRVFNGKPRVYLDSHLIIPTTSDDENELEIEGVITSCSTRFYFHNGHSYYNFTIKVEDGRLISWVDTCANDSVAEIAFKLPRGSKVSAKGKVQSGTKIINNQIQQKWKFIPYHIEYRGKQDE